MFQKTLKTSSNFIKLQAGTWDEIVKIIEKHVDYKTGKDRR